MTLRDMYEEFWEFIDENNKNFHDFIVRDNRRQKFSIISNLSKGVTV